MHVVVVRKLRRCKLFIEERQTEFAEVPEHCVITALGAPLGARNEFAEYCNTRTARVSRTLLPVVER